MVRIKVTVFFLGMCMVRVSVRGRVMVAVMVRVG